MQPQYIDSHAHVNFSDFDTDREVVIKRALEAGIWVVNVGSDQESSEKAVEMAHEYEEGIYAVVGMHPTDIADLPAGGFDYDFYKKLAQDLKALAIGEIGLDYHHFNEGDDVEALKARQKEVLIKFIDLANEVGKPVMLHCWDARPNGPEVAGRAYDDLLEILTDHPVEERGIVHSFVGGFRTAKKFIELGYFIGLNGVVTYTPDFNRLIIETPLEKMVIETDCPYLAPGAKKGKRNEPLFVEEVAVHIAKIKEISEGEVARATTENTRKILNF